jgi:hypothetical protein
MASLYDNIKLANSQYVPQFIGSNYEQLQSTADKLDERYRRNKELTDQVQIALAQDKFLEGDEGYRKQLQDKIQSDIDLIASTPENFENSSAGVAQIAKQYATDRNRLGMIENYNRAQQAEKMLLEYGPDALNFGDDHRSFSSLGEDGQIKRFNLDILKRPDYDKRKETLWDDLKADMHTGKLQKSDLIDYYKQITTGGISGSKDPNGKGKVNNYLDNALGRYMATTEGKTEFRELKQRGLTDEQAERTIKATTLAAGLEHVFSVYKEDYSRKSDKVIDDILNPKEQPSPYYTPTSQTVSNNNFNTKLTTSSDLKVAETEEVYTDKDGNPINLGSGPTKRTYRKYEENGKWYKAPVISDGKSTFLDKGLAKEIPDPNSNEPGTVGYQYDRVLNLSPETLKKYGYDSKEAFEKAYEQSQKRNDKLALPAQQIEGEQAKEYDDVIARNIQDATIYLADSPNGVSAEEAGIEYDNNGNPMISISKIVSALPNKIGGGGAEILIKRKGGAPKRAFVELNDPFSQQTAWVNNVLAKSTFSSYDVESQNAGEGNNIDNPLVNNNEYAIKQDDDKNIYQDIAYTITVPTPNEKRPFKTIVKRGIRAYDKDGNSQDIWGEEANKMFEGYDFSDIEDDKFQALEFAKAKQRLKSGVNTTETIMNKVPRSVADQRGLQ